MTNCASLKYGIQLAKSDSKPSHKGTYKYAQCIVMVYDITDSSTFEAIKTWYEEIFEYARENVAVILVGNKSDLDSERQVSFEGE